MVELKGPGRSFTQHSYSDEADADKGPAAGESADKEAPSVASTASGSKTEFVFHFI